jgi:hypothetical protein
MSYLTIEVIGTQTDLTYWKFLFNSSKILYLNCTCPSGFLISLIVWDYFITDNKTF